MISPARMKKGIAIKGNESIPPNMMVMSTDTGIPRMCITIREAIPMATEIGNPRKMNDPRKRNINITIAIV